MDPNTFFQRNGTNDHKQPRSTPLVPMLFGEVGVCLNPPQRALERGIRQDPQASLCANEMYLPDYIPVTKPVYAPCLNVITVR